MRVWIDVDNPPQVQYLLPLGAAFEAKGTPVVITARDYAITLELLRQRGVGFEAVGSGFGKARLEKVVRTIDRAYRLRRVVRRQRPDLLIAGSRASTIAAYTLRVPSFTPCDYEHTELASARLTGSYILYPDVIDQAAFLRRGIRQDRLVPFPGLKEHLTFSGVDLAAVEPLPLRTVDDELPRLLFRPPSETAHYYATESTAVAHDVLGRLAERDDVIVVFAPRVQAQAAYLERYNWRRAPVLLDYAAPFLSLLKAVDAVVASGGTMVREAAFLGIPAYSILRSDIGQVDKYLESIGRLHVIDQIDELEVTRRDRSELDPLASGTPDLVQKLTETIAERALERR